MPRRFIVTLAILAGFILTVWMPLNRQWTENDRLSALKTEESRLAQELAEAQQEYLDVLGPVETEKMARQRFGMVRPGERAYVVSAPAQEVELPEVVEKAAVTDGGSWWSNALNMTGRVLRAVV